MIRFLIIITLVWFRCTLVFAQDIYFGNDLSYVNQMEDCGAVFREYKVEKDVFQIFKDHGTNLVRVRLWHNPTWQNSLLQPDGVKSQYNDYKDVHETISRAKALGMNVMLGFHFSDVWADPARQIVPKAWADIADTISILKDSVYNYVIKVLTDLNTDGLLPEIIKIGNENNIGIMRYRMMDDNLDPLDEISSDWSRNAQLYNAAINAVRDLTDTIEIKPKIALHCADPSKTTWWYNNIINKGVTDFDIIGFSYYYAYHGLSISDVGNQIEQLKSDHPDYDVMIVETGYLWSERNFDDMGNIITTPDPDYLPVSKEKQLEYMVDLQREVICSGGVGTIFWEPAWVSTDCRTPWGKGSSNDHVVYFDPVYTNFMEGGGGQWMESRFYEDVNSPKVTFKVNMSGQTISRGVFIKGTWSDNYQEMVQINDSIFSLAVYEIDTNSSGGFYFLNGESEIYREDISSYCALWESTDRKYTVGKNDTIISRVFSFCEDDPDTLNSNIYLDDNIKNKEVDVYPNPTKGVVTIDFPSTLEVKSISVMDVRGRARYTVPVNSNEQTKTINLTSLSPGLYFVQLIGKEQTIIRKVQAVY